MRKGILPGAILIAGLFLSVTPQARGNGTIYWDTDFGFDPSLVVIGPSETVTWWNIDPYGMDLTVTFDNSVSFSLTPFHGRGVIFPSQPGTYGFHSNYGDTGAVIVNVAPTISITTPANNAVLAAPATFTIQATATDSPDDYIYDVEFFLGTSDSTNSIVDVFAEPFSAGVTNLDAGVYTLIAVARDSHGWATETAINLTVGGSPTVSLTLPRISAGQFLFDATGLTVGKTNVVQSSTNLMAWNPISTNVAASTSRTFTNAMVLPRRFFRLLELP